jgi:hypothetical protein
MQLTTETERAATATRQPTTTPAATLAAINNPLKSGTQVGPSDALGDRAVSQHGDSMYTGTSYYISQASESELCL